MSSFEDVFFTITSTCKSVCYKDKKYYSGPFQMNSAISLNIYFKLK